MTIVIKGIDTKPERDVWQNIGGQSTYTEFWLDTEDGTCGVTQECRNNSTTFRRYHNIERNARIQGHPKEESVREFIEDNMDLLERVFAGSTIEWNGNNHVGQLNDDARDAWETFERRCEEMHYPGNGDEYQFWSVDEWLDQAMSQITADTTKEELNEFIEESKALAEAEDVILDGDIADFCRDYWETQKRERELYGE